MELKIFFISAPHPQAGNYSINHRECVPHQDASYSTISPILLWCPPLIPPTFPTLLHYLIFSQVFSIN